MHQTRKGKNWYFAPHETAHRRGCGANGVGALSLATTPAHVHDFLTPSAGAAAR